MDKVASGECVCLALRLAAESRRVARRCPVCCVAACWKTVLARRQAELVSGSLTQLGSERRQVQVAVLEVQLVVPCNDSTLGLKHLVQPETLECLGSP